MGNDAPCVPDLGNDTLPVSRGLVPLGFLYPILTQILMVGRVRYLFFMYGQRIRGMSKFAAGR